MVSHAQGRTRVERPESPVSSGIAVVVLILVGALLIVLGTVPIFGFSSPVFATKAWMWPLPLLLAMIALQLTRTVVLSRRPDLRWVLAWANLAIQVVSVSTGWYLVASRGFINPDLLREVGLPPSMGLDALVSSVVLATITLISFIDVVATLVRAERAKA